MSRIVAHCTAVVLLVSATASAQLSAAWMVPASAHTRGVGGTEWHTDVSIHNPHEYELPVVVQALPSDHVNTSVPTVYRDVGPWETLNMWDVLGPEWFDLGGTAALLVYVDPDVACSGAACDLLVTSRTYTLDPTGRAGEFGQAVPAAGLLEGIDWQTYGYAAGILNDGAAFRCNVGVASWTSAWITVRLDVQDASGAIVGSRDLDVPPFGHVQRRLDVPVMGGSLVFYVLSGPGDALVFPYASVVDQNTGDPAYFGARWSGVGVTTPKDLGRGAGREMRTPPAAEPVVLPPGPAQR